jgi:hypothetical protein
MTALDVFLDALAEEIATRIDGRHLAKISRRAEAEVRAQYYVREAMRDAGIRHGPRPEAECYVERPMPEVRIRDRVGSTEWKAPGNRFVPPGKVTKARFGVRA